MTDKSDDGVEHLNTILAQGGGNLNDPIFRSSNAQGLPRKAGGGGGGMLKFPFDRRLIFTIQYLVPLFPLCMKSLIPVFKDAKTNSAIFLI